MDINHVCTHCFRGKTVFRISLDLYDENGILRRGVTRMKKFEFKKTRKGTIRFKRCKKQIGKYCVTLLLDKMVVRLCTTEEVD